MITENFKAIFKNKLFWVSFILLIIGLVSNSISSLYLKSEYSSLPSLPDILLDNLPTYQTGWLYDSLALLSIILIIYYLFVVEKPYKIPYLVMLFAIYQILRAVFIILTPFALPTSIDATQILDGTAFDYGLYPSGHTGTAFLGFLFSRGLIKWLLLIVTFAIIISLLLGESHYTIDILSGLIFSYAIFTFGERVIKKWMI